MFQLSLYMSWLEAMSLKETEHRNKKQLLITIQKKNSRHQLTKSWTTGVCWSTYIFLLQLFYIPSPLHTVYILKIIESLMTSNWLTNTPDAMHPKDSYWHQFWWCQYAYHTLYQRNLLLLQMYEHLSWYVTIHPCRVNCYSCICDHTS